MKATASTGSFTRYIPKNPNHFNYKSQYALNEQDTIEREGADASWRSRREKKKHMTLS